jgi:C4-dicarboxylate transporter DctQ subunit
VGRDDHCEPARAHRWAGADLVLRQLGPGRQRWVEAFNCIVALGFSVGMVWYGANIAYTSWLLDERSASDFGFPMWLYYSALPVGGLLMGVRYVIRLWRYVFYFDPETMTVGHVPEHELPLGGGQ